MGVSDLGSSSVFGTEVQSKGWVGEGFVNNKSAHTDIFIGETRMFGTVMGSSARKLMLMKNEVKKCVLCKSYVMDGMKKNKKKNTRYLWSNKP